jgi:hypothetical protein
MGQARTAAARATVAVSAALLVLSMVLWTFPAVSRADGLSGYLEYTYSKNGTDSVDAGGQSSRTRSDSLSQSYNLTLDKTIYPNLRLSTYGIYQQTDASSENNGVAFDSTTAKIRPYISLSLRTPLYFAEAAYSRNDEKLKTNGSSPVTTVRDLTLGTIYWRPDRFPDFKFQVSREHNYDRNRSIVDTVTDTYQVTSNYRPVEPLWLYYSGSLRDSDMKVSETRTKETTHNGRANYSNSWWRRRITLGMDYNIRKQEIDTETTGAGEVGLPVFPFSGLSALSDTPENVPLVSNAALVDGTLTAGTGLNLGLPPPGGDARPRNMGLDFLIATEINTLYVWVDREVTQVADAFSWRIYTSDDNLNWTLRQTVSPAFYNTTFNRFEIRFTNVNARYVKAVASPLTPAIPFSSFYPIILVTELQSELRRPASEVAGTQRSTFQTGSVDFRALLLDSINLTYEFAYLFTNKDPGDSIYAISNGLSFFRQFNKVFSGRGRVAYETAEDRQGNRETKLYTASVTAVPTQTFFQSLTFSGKDESLAGKKNSEMSFLLYNVAKLYEGIDANLSGGITFQKEEAGRENKATQANGGVTFVPNRKVTFSLLYNGSKSVASGGNLAEETTTYTRSGEADLSFTPVQTVYLFGSYRVEKSTALPSRTIMNYSLNWSPFPDGTLHFTFYYNETVRSDDTKERSIVPSLRWYFMPRSYMEISYQNSKTEAPAQDTTTDVYSGTVRVSF